MPSMLAYILGTGDCLSSCLQRIFKGKRKGWSPAQGKILLECIISSCGVGRSPRFHEMLVSLLGLLKSYCVRLRIFTVQVEEYLSARVRDQG